MTEAEMEAVSALGRRQHFADGHVLIHEGEQDFAFYVVVSGDIDMLTRRSTCSRQ